MTAVTYQRIRALPSELVVLDIERRLYAGLSRDSSYWHIVQPVRIDDPRVGDGKRHAGDLVCTCASGSIRGTCYRVEEAEALEAAVGVAQAVLA